MPQDTRTRAPALRTALDAQRVAWARPATATELEGDAAGGSPHRPAPPRSLERPTSAARVTIT